MSLLWEKQHLCVAITSGVIWVGGPSQVEQRGGTDPVVSHTGAWCSVGNARPLPSVKAVIFGYRVESCSNIMMICEEESDTHFEETWL